MIRAISRAERVKVPGGGAVEIVVTSCTQRRLARVLRMDDGALTSDPRVHSTISFLNAARWQVFATSLASHQPRRA